MPTRRQPDAHSNITFKDEGAKPELFPIHGKFLPRVWPHVRHLIEAAMLRGGMRSFAALERAIHDGEALLWVVWNTAESVTMAAVATVADINGVRTGTVVAVGGHGLRRFGPLLADLERYFRDCDCTRVHICGRRGWQRWYRDYKLRAVVLEKSL
jgi:hypothetical protein